jgi:hypothetical protein
MFATQDDAAVDAAHRRLRARAMALRADWRNIETNCRNALTSPAMIGGAAIAGAMIGSRTRPRPAPVECECVKAKASFLRLSFFALVTPLLQEAMANGLAHLVAGRGDRSPASAPSPSVSKPAPTGIGA